MRVGWGNALRIPELRRLEKGTAHGLLGLVLVLGSGTSRALAQSAVAPCPVGSSAKSQPAGNVTCTPDPPPAVQVPAAPSVQGPAASKRFPFPADSTQEAVPENPKASTAPAIGPASKRFPYPGEQSEEPESSLPGSSANPKAPASSGQGSPLQDAGSSGESSSSSGSAASPEANPAQTSQSSSSSSSAAGQSSADSPFTEPDPDTAPAPRKGRKKLPPVARQTPSEREEEDVRVAGFYQNDGNYAAAYQRASDAVALVSDDPDAHLALAEAARRLGKLDEAQKHYKRCLELDPVPKGRKLAERALKEMSGGGS